MQAMQTLRRWESEQHDSETAGKAETYWVSGLDKKIRAQQEFLEN